jgi:hypothetical protein
MENKTYNDYSTQNYDNLLIGWAQINKPNLTISFELDAISVSKCNYNIKSKFWTIIDEYERLTHNDVIVNNYGIINDKPIYSNWSKKIRIFLMKLMNLK